MPAKFGPERTHISQDIPYLFIRETVFPCTHSSIRFAFMNAPEQSTVEPILNNWGSEVRRRRNKLHSQRPFAVDSVATDASVDVNLPSTDWIAAFR